MRYCLTTTRKIDKYIQKCIVNFPDTFSQDPITQGKNQFTNTSYFPGQLSGCDGSGWTTGTIEYKSFTEEAVGLTTNQGTKCDMTVDVISNVANNPKVYSFKLNSVAKANIAYSLITKIQILSGQSFPNSNMYIVNCIFDLHD